MFKEFNPENTVHQTVHNFNGWTFKVEGNRGFMNI
jgi:hypothetical protein